MTDVTVEVRGAQEVIASLDTLAQDLDHLDLSDAGQEVLDACRVPVDTGLLLSSGYTDPGPGRVRVGFAAPYAGYVEARTGFFRQGVNAATPDMARATEAQVQQAADQVRGA